MKREDNILPDVSFGLGPSKIDWRAIADDFDPDDEELETTPQDIIDLLGFDPKELEQEEKQIGVLSILKGGPGSGNFGHGGRPGEVGGSSSAGGQETDIPALRVGQTEIRVQENVATPTWKRSLETKAAAELKRVASLGGKVSTILSNRPVKHILFTSQEGMNSFVSTGEVKGSLKGLYDASQIWMSSSTLIGEGFKGLAGGSGSDYTLRHEMGHHLYRYIGINAKTDFMTSVWMKGKIAGRVSRYAKTNIEECFCESFARYTSPKHKEGLPKEVTDFMKEHLKI